MNSQIQLRRVYRFNDPTGPINKQPAHRPLHIYRNTLTPGCFIYGPLVKFFKGGDCSPYGGGDCNPPIPVRGRRFGSVSSFSGRAQIRTASTIVKPNYYQGNEQYLRSRGNLYETKLVGSPVPGTSYLLDCTPVAPDAAQPVSLTSSSIYQGSASNDLACNRTVYKPSNYKYSKDGAVQSSTRMTRLQQDLKRVVASPLKPGLKLSSC